MKLPTLHRRQRGQRGFTLIEVMVAILLTVIAVIGIVALYTVQARASDYSRRTNEASVYGEDKLEDLRTTNLAAFISPAVDYLDDNGTVYTSPGTSVVFTRTTTMTLNALGWYDYNVVVSWSEDGVAKNVQLFGRIN